MCQSESNLPYDIKDIIHRVVDDGDFFEVQEHFAQEHRRRLRPHGRTVGRHRRQSARVPGGCLDINSSVKGARFVRFCDASIFRS